MNEFLAPHRERRAELAKDMDSVRDILHDGNARANAIANQTLDEVREAMGMRYDRCAQRHAEVRPHCRLPETTCGCGRARERSRNVKGLFSS